MPKYAFNWKSNLQRHLKTRINLGPTTLKRDEFSQVLSSKEDTSSNSMDINITPEEAVPLKFATPETAVKMSICPTCSKIFSTYFNLTQHIKIHLNEKLYTCDLCQKSFGRKLA